MFTFYRKYDNGFYVCFGHEGLSRNEGQAQSGGRYDGQSLLAWIDSGMLYETSRFIREASVSSTKLKLILAFTVIAWGALFYVLFSESFSSSWREQRHQKSIQMQAIIHIRPISSTITSITWVSANVTFQKKKKITITLGEGLL